ncbi:MAG: DUF6785 family protein, partial [Candidatus Bathyarchaeia archaeon]
MELPRVSGFTPRVVILGLFLVFVSMIFNRMICGLTGLRGFLPPPIFIVLFIISALSYYTGRLRLTPQESTILYIIGFASTASVFMNRPYLDFGIGNQIGQFLSPIIFMAAHPTYSPQLKHLIPPILRVNDEALASIWLGGSVNLFDFTGLILFWLIYLLSFAFWSLFFALLSRKQLIEVEGLPFPTAIPYERVIVYTVVPETGEKPLLLRKESKFFWIGFVIGLIISAPQIYAYFAPVPPFFYGVAALNLTPYLGSVLPG